MRKRISLFVFLFVFVFIHFASSQSLDLCPVGCPVACLQPNDTVGLEVVDGIIYVVDGPYNETQNGSILNPFSAIDIAIKALKNYPNSVTILVDDGEYEFVDVLLLTEDFAGVELYDITTNVSWTKSQKITLNSINGPDSTSITCGNKNLLRLWPMVPSTSNIITLNFTLEGFTFEGCTSGLTYGGLELEVSNCVFNEIQQTITVINTPTVYLHDLSFTDCAQAILLSDVQAQVQRIEVSNSDEFGSTEYDSISLMSQYINAVAYISDITYDSIKAYSLSVYDDSEVYAENIVLYACQKYPFYLQNCEGTFDNIDVSGTEDDSTFLVFIGSQFTITNMHIYDVSIKSSVIYVQGCEIEFVDLTVESSTGAASVFSFYEASEVTISGGLFQNNYGSLFYITQGSEVTMLNSIVQNNNYNNTGVLCSNSAVTLSNNIIQDNGFSSSFIYGTNANIEVTDNNIFTRNSNSKSDSACGLLDLYRSQGLIDDVSVTLNTGVSGGFVCLEAGSKLVVSGSNFEKNTVTKNGGVFACTGGNLTISNSNFTSNQAYNGGAIYSQALSSLSIPVFNITNSNFNNNTADFGGAIYVNVYNDFYPSIISTSNLDFNIAQQRGGALFSASNTYFPTIDASTIFLNNQALLSGNQAAGPAIRIQFEDPPPIQANKSGYYLEPFTLTLRDSYDSIVFLGETEALIMKAEIEGSSSSKRDASGAEVIGEIQKAVLDGVVTFSNLRVVGTPGTYNVTVRSNVKAFNDTIFRVSFTVVINSCTIGYVIEPITESNFGICTLAVCSQGCIKGTCTAKDECSCGEGYIGSACEYRDVPVYYPEYTQSGPLAIAIITGALIGLALFFGITIFLYRDTPVIKSASPSFCLVSISGIILAYISIYTYIGKPSVALCTSNLWLINMAFIISFSPILVKNWRIYQIFDSELYAIRKRLIQLKGLVIACSIMIGIELILLIIWSAYDAPGLKTILRDDGSSYEMCGSQVNQVFSTVLLIIVIVYNALITLSAAWLAFKTKSVISAFRDSSAIAISVYNFAIIAVIILPIIYFAQDTFSPEAIFYLKTIAVLIVTTFGMLVLYGPKVFIVYIAKDRNVLPRDKLIKGSSEFSKRPSGSQVIEMKKVESPETQLGINGDLYIQLTIFKLWRRRYVEVVPSVGLIVLFDDSRKIRTGHVFAVQHISVLDRRDHGPGCFMIRSTAGLNSEWMFQAESPEACETWINIINHVRQLHKPESNETRQSTQISRKDTQLSEHGHSLTMANDSDGKKFEI